MRAHAGRRTAGRPATGPRAAVVLCVVSLLVVGCETTPTERATARAMVNHERAAAGSRPLEPSTTLDATADAWARSMRDAWVAAGCPRDASRFLRHSRPADQHNPDGALPGWRRLGENVAMAPRNGRTRDAALLRAHAGFLRSADHRANMVDPRFSLLGVGAVFGPTADQQRRGACPSTPTDNYLWTTHAFIG